MNATPPAAPIRAAVPAPAPMLDPAEAAAHMEEFRAWDRLYRQRRNPVSWKRALLNRGQRPFKTVSRAWRDVRAIGAEVAAVSGVPRSRQFAQLLLLRARYDLGPQFYCDYQMYLPERWARVGLFMPEPPHTRLAGFLHRAYASESDGPRIADKGEFSAWCAEHGLPAVPILALWDDGVLVHDGLAGRALPADDLFSKPADMNQGWQTARWRYDGAGGYVGHDGRTRTAAALLEELAAASRQIPSRRTLRSTRLLLMPCLKNHPRNLPLTTGALCSMRVVTYRAPGGRAQLLVASYKMATGDAPADNFHFGGMLAPVDLATGRLGMGLRRQGRVLVPTDRHPDTGATIPGHQLPDWDTAIALAVRAHDAARVSPLFGWDVALTPDGPVLLEGNIDGSPDIAQAPSGQPMGATPYVAAVNAHMRVLEARGLEQWRP